MTAETQHTSKGHTGQQGQTAQGGQSGTSQQSQHSGQQPGQLQQGQTPSQEGKAATPTAFVTGGFARTLSKILPYFGTSMQGANNPQTGQSQLMALGVTNPTTITIPQNPQAVTPAPTLMPSIAAGYVRIKLIGGGSPTSISVQGTDGTNTEWLYIKNITGGPTLSATVGMTVIIPFESELNCTQFIITIAGVTGEADVEIAGSAGDS